jgi:hypothetical protein
MANYCRAVTKSLRGTPTLIISYLLVTWGVVSSPPCRRVPVAHTVHLDGDAVVGPSPRYVSSFYLYRLPRRVIISDNHARFIVLYTVGRCLQVITVLNRIGVVCNHA